LKVKVRAYVVDVEYELSFLDKVGWIVKTKGLENVPLNLGHCRGQFS